MTEQKHTPEPWRIGSQSKDIIYLQGDEPRGELGPSGNWIDCNTAANARRIVACVNACAGIETGTLEKLGFGGARKVPPNIRKIEQQRDQLRAVLEGLLGEVEGCMCTYEMPARAALAATEGV